MEDSSQYSSQMTEGNRARVDRTLDQMDKKDLVGMDWADSKPMEKIMIRESQGSIIHNNAWLEACLQVPTKGTWINDNGDSP